MTVFLSIVLDISFAIRTAFILITSLFSALLLLLWFCSRQLSQWDHSQDHEPKCLKLAVIHDFEKQFAPFKFPFRLIPFGGTPGPGFLLQDVVHINLLLTYNRMTTDFIKFQPWIVQWLYTVEFVILLILTLHALNILEKTHWLGDTCFFMLCILPKFQGGWLINLHGCNSHLRTSREKMACFYRGTAEMTCEIMFLTSSFLPLLLSLVCPFLVT